MNEILGAILPITAMFLGLLTVIKFYISKIEKRIYEIEIE